MHESRSTMDSVVICLNPSPVSRCAGFWVDPKVTYTQDHIDAYGDCRTPVVPAVLSVDPFMSWTDPGDSHSVVYSDVPKTQQLEEYYTDRMLYVGVLKYNDTPRKHCRKVFACGTPVALDGKRMSDTISLVMIASWWSEDVWDSDDDYRVAPDQLYFNGVHHLCHKIYDWSLIDFEESLVFGGDINRRLQHIADRTDKVMQLRFPGCYPSYGEYIEMFKRVPMTVTEARNKGLLKGPISNEAEEWQNDNAREFWRSVVDAETRLLARGYNIDTVAMRKMIVYDMDGYKDT